MKAIPYAFLAAVFYAINIPASKVLLRDVGPTTMAALLYLGAGIGIAILSFLNTHDRKASAPLTHRDMPFVIGMIVLDIAAPIFHMLGIRYGTSANASLLCNFEIVATTMIALFVFKEAVSKRLWIAIALITLASILLSFEGTDSFRFSYGSLLVIAATVCWGFENNCTRNIASKDTYEIVVIFLYVRAQNTLGAAKTSAYYAVAPFVGALLSFVLLKEGLSWMYLAALGVMVAGAALVVVDTLVRHHTHPHQHTFTHFHGGYVHTHTITHTRGHDHLMTDGNHAHRHTRTELERSLPAKPASSQARTSASTCTCSEAVRFPDEQREELCKAKSQGCEA